MSNHWLITPHKGVGDLVFGLSPQVVASMASIYGKPGPLTSYADSASDVEAVIAEYGARMSAETLAVIRQAAKEQANLSTQHLTNGQTQVLLEYRDGRLDGVTIESPHKEANFDGTLVFSLTAVDVLRLFERANGAPGRYRSSEAAFDTMAVSLDQFSITSSTGVVRAMSDSSPDFQARSVTLRREPYRPQDESDQFVTFSFD